MKDALPGNGFSRAPHHQSDAVTCWRCVEFLVSTNPGQLRGLAKGGAGGELSRDGLAIPG